MKKYSNPIHTMQEDGSVVQIQTNKTYRRDLEEARKEYIDKIHTFAFYFNWTDSQKERCLNTKEWNTEKGKNFILQQEEKLAKLLNKYTTTIEKEKQENPNHYIYLITRRDDNNDEVTEVKKIEKTSNNFSYLFDGLNFSYQLAYNNPFGENVNVILEKQRQEDIKRHKKLQKQEEANQQENQAQQPTPTTINRNALYGVGRGSKF